MYVQPMQNSCTLNVQWNHDYHLCHNFTVYLDDMAIPECTNIAALNCTIGHLDYGIQYEMKVVATDSGSDPIEASAVVDASAGM